MLISKTRYLFNSSREAVKALVKFTETHVASYQYEIRVNESGAGWQVTVISLDDRILGNLNPKGSI